MFSSLEKQLEQYAEGQLLGEMNKIPGPDGCNQLGSSCDCQRRALLSWTVTGNLAVWSWPVASVPLALCWNATPYVCHGLLESLMKDSSCLSCKISNG